MIAILCILGNLFFSQPDSCRQYKQYESAYEYINNSKILDSNLIYNTIYPADSIIPYISSTILRYGHAFFADDIINYECNNCNDSAKKIIRDQLREGSKRDSVGYLPCLRNLKKDEPFNYYIIFSEIVDNKMTAIIYPLPDKKQQVEYYKYYYQYYSVQMPTHLIIHFHFDGNNVKKVFSQMIAG